jgi:DNA-binding winged helix-turn-helix (wHTH) protein
MTMPSSGSAAETTKLKLGDFVVDLGAQLLCDASGAAVALRPQAWAVLRHLVLHVGQLVTKEALLESVWPHVVVTDGSLVQAVSDVRDALGEAGHRWIKTIPRRGYMLLADALTTLESDAPQACSEMELPVPSQDTMGRWQVAVLAFGSPDGGADDQAIARALASEVSLELARSAELRVASHHASFALAGADLALPAVGRRLGSRYVVDGTVTRDGDTLHVGIQLVDSQSGHLMWAARHAAAGACMRRLRSDLAHRIAAEVLNKTILIGAAAQLTTPPKVGDVHAMTERGRALARRLSPDAIHQARLLCGQAVALDPGYAQAWAALAGTNYVDLRLRITGQWDDSRLGECVAHAQRALALDPECVQALGVLGSCCRLRGEFGQALALAERAASLSPANADSVAGHVLALIGLGLPEPALSTAKAALQLDSPPMAWVQWSYAQALWVNEHLAEALHASDEALAVMPHFWLARTTRAGVLAQMGRVEEARGEALRGREQLPDLTIELIELGISDRLPVLYERRWRLYDAVGFPSATGSRWARGGRECS